MKVLADARSKLVRPTNKRDTDGRSGADGPARQAAPKTPAAKRARRSTRTKTELEARVIDAATQLFSERGYQSVSIREITRAANVALPVMYWFFPSKRSLYVACYFRLAKTSLQQLWQALEGLSDPLEILYVFTVTVCEHNVSHRTSKIVHRVLLDRDMPILKEFAAVFFDSELTTRTRSAAEAVVGVEAAQRKLLSIYSLSTGFIEHAPFWNLSPGNQWECDEHEAIALFVLETVFPNVISWSEVKSRVNRSNNERPPE